MHRMEDVEQVTEEQRESKQVSETGDIVLSGLVLSHHTEMPRNSL
jgi:hypothetical protein